MRSQTVTILEFVRAEARVVLVEMAFDRLADGERGGLHRAVDLGISPGLARFDMIGAGRALLEAGGRDAVGAVGRQLDHHTTVQRVAVAVVVRHLETARSGDEQIGIEIVRGEAQLDLLPSAAADQVGVLILAGAALRIDGRQFAVHALSHAQRRRRPVADALRRYRRGHGKPKDGGEKEEAGAHDESPFVCR